MDNYRIGISTSVWCNQTVTRKNLDNDSLKSTSNPFQVISLHQSDAVRIKQQFS